MPPVNYYPTVQEAQQLELDRQQNSPLAVFQKHLNAQDGLVVPTTPGTGGAVNAATTASGNSNLANLSNPDWIKAMSEMITQINTDAQQKINAARIPNATGLEQKSSEDIGAALRGELPADVVRQLGQRAAERGVYSGSPMGANSTADLMRSLGLTSLDLQNQGQGWLTAALGRNPGATPANTQALVTTPAQAEQLAIARQNMELDYLAKMAAIQAANNRTRSGYGGGGGGSGGGGRFAPATNWQGAPTATGSPTPITQPWHLPNFPTNYPDTVQPGMDYGGGFDTVLPGMNYYDASGSPPANTYYNPANNTSDYNPFGDYFGSYGGGNVGGIDQGGMSQDELDWLYNVGG